MKPWFAIRDKCQLCFGDATAIEIPPSWLTYISYGLYVVVPALIVAYLATDERGYLELALLGVAAMLVISFIDLSRGAAYAKTRLKVTDSDRDEFERRGWI